MRSSLVGTARAITEAPAPSHPIPRGFAGPSLLAMALVNKFLLHQPLNRQSKTFAREGIEIDVSTLADRVGACVVALDPLVQAIRAHVLSAERIHADDTTVPVLAKLKTVVGRIWTYVRDDRPFGGQGPPAASFHYSRSRAGEHPQSHLAGYVGLMQADAFNGYNDLYEARRKPAPILEAACWSHGRRKFIDLVKQGEAPIASEAVRRIDMLFEIERSINGKTPEQRLAVRRERSRPLIAELEIWMRQQRALLSTKNDTAKAINYSLNRWAAFTRFLDDGRVCLSNNAAERALRGIAIGRKNWTFAGSDAGGDRAAAIYTLIETCLCRARHRQVYAARRTMPNRPGMACRCHAGIVDRVHGSPIPFGIVWWFRAPRGRRAGGRSAGSGFACRAHTA